MQVDVVIEQRFYCCAEHQFWTENAFPYDFWTRYLQVFSAVNIVARVMQVDKPQSDWKRVDGPQVNFVALPSYIGPWQFVSSLLPLLRVLRSRKSANRAVIYRIPGILSALYQFAAQSKNSPYGAEVVGDPADVFAKGASKSVLRPLIKYIFVKLLRAQCQAASAISYVTEFSLQRRYPPKPAAFHTHYSSIQLEDADFVTKQRYVLSSELNIVCIGNLSQPYKGCDFMLQTLAQLKQQGLEFTLRWVGGGYLQAKMEEMAKQLGIAQHVTFVGNLADRQAIRDELDKADIFVLSSRQEGLPRVLIEAMARSLVCVATNVGGVPELLPATFVIERDNHAQLAGILNKVHDFSASQLLTISQQNHQKAREYENVALVARRNAMYQHLLDTM
ncbi:glycosyltransferase [Paraglaciecola sp.]|uniref:glycosyltransferase n=1 Tax=Paraglaciecola sp. TaxID=1920173 RepID=UPI0030F48BA9